MRPKEAERKESFYVVRKVRVLLFDVKREGDGWVEGKARWRKKLILEWMRHRLRESL